MMLNFQRPAVLFLIKRSLGRFLKGDIEASQVDARIGAGLLELRDLKLDCEYISTLLGFSGLEVVDGFVSRIEVQIDWSTFSARIALEEILVTIRPCKASAWEQSMPASPAKEQAGEETEGALKQETLLDYLLKKLKVVLNGLTIRLESPSVPQKALMIHGQRVACGFESDEDPELDEYEPQDDQSCFSVVAEGISLEVWDSDQSDDKSRKVELAALKGGQIQLTTDTSLGYLERNLNITLGWGGLSVEATLVDYLKDGIAIACSLASRCTSSMEGDNPQAQELESALGPNTLWDSNDDDDDFFDCLTGSGSTSNSRSGRGSVNRNIDVSKPQSSCLQIKCTSPLLYCSLDYFPSSNVKPKEDCGGLDLFLEKVCFFCTIGAEQKVAIELTVASIVCFERFQDGEGQLSPKQAQDFVGRLKSPPPRLQEFVSHGSQIAVNSDGSSDVLPLLQLGLHCTRENDKKYKPCLVMQVSHQAQSSLEINIHSEPLAIWCSCLSLKNILTAVEIIRKCFEQQSKESVSDQVQRVINDIDARGDSGRKPCKGKLNISWWTPMIIFSIEKKPSVEGRSGLFFGQWCCSGAQNKLKDLESPFLRFEKSHEFKNVRGRGGRCKIETLQVQAAHFEVFNVAWPTEEHEGKVSSILQFESKSLTSGGDSNLMCQADEIGKMRAVDIELRMRPDYSGNLMVEVADSFLDWHSADRWTKGDSSWAEEGKYREVEFRAKCVEHAKLFTRVHMNSIKAYVSQVDIQDALELIASVIPTHKGDTIEREGGDQVTLLVTGAIECNLQCLQPHVHLPDVSAIKSSSNYQIVVEDMGFLRTEGLSSKHNSAVWVWARGLKLTGGPMGTCSILLPAPLDSQLPNPQGIEYAQVVKSSRGTHDENQATERVSLRVRGITVTTDMDDLKFEVLRGLAEYLPPNKQSQKPSREKEKLFAVNLENFGFRCEPRRNWTSTSECPPVAGVVYLEDAHCAGSSSAVSHQIVTRSLSVHLANCEKRGNRRWGTDVPIDLQGIQLQQEGFSCLAQEGTLRIGVHLSRECLGGKRARMSVDIANQQLFGTFTQDSLFLATCFVRQLQGIVPIEEIHEALDAGATNLDSKRFNLLECLDESAFRHKSVDPMLASECIDGAWSEESISTVGIVDDWISDFPSAANCPSESGPAPNSHDSTQGVWLNGAPPAVVEDYIPEAEMQEESISFQNRMSGCLHLSEEHPEPLLTICLQDVSVMCILKDKSSSDQGKLELELQGVSVRIDSFPENSHFIWRSAVQVQCFELRDCRNAASHGWQSILSRHIKRSRVFGEQHSHHLASPMLEFTLEAVHPQLEKVQEEMRVRIALVPLRLRLDQAVVKFLMEYIDSIPSAPEPLSEIGPEEVPFFQFCEVEAINVMVDYLPRKLDMVALRRGNVGEVLNFVRWGGVKLSLKSMKLTGHLGWDSLFAAMIHEWQKEIVGKQVHKFLKGIPPVRSILRIGSACQTVLTDSIETLIPPATSRVHSSKSFMRGRLKKSTVELVRIIALEALNAGASVAAGAQFVLLGSLDDNANCKSGSQLTPGFYQTRACIESAFNTIVKEPVESYKNGEGAGPLLLKTLRATPAAMVAPATAAATALRCTLVGCKNKLDVNRALDD